MEKVLWENAKKSKWVIATFFGACYFTQKAILLPGLLREEVFGADGNGGRMLKIITNLTDEEMARLRLQRRFMWHWRGVRRPMTHQDTITDQELSDRGIILTQEPYIEYEKRAPHDKYL